MVYICRNCNFIFTRVEEPKRCPNCEKEGYIQEASEEEKREFEKVLENMKHEIE